MVIHEYFRVDRDLILDIVQNQLGPMADALTSQTDHQGDT